MVNKVVIFTIIFFSCRPLVTTFNDIENAKIYTANSIENIIFNDTLKVMTWNIRFGAARIPWFGDSCGEVALADYESVEKIREKIVVKIPNEISHKIAATLMTKGLTTNYLLTETYPLKAGETVLFHAAAGGVGQIFAQWANSIGAKVIGTVGSDDKMEIAKKNGYEHVINYSKNDFAKEVMKITNNEGVTAVFDGVGKKTFKGSIACLKKRGMMISFGNASGPLEPINVQKEIQAKSLFFTRPAGGHYFTEKKELQTAADTMFKKVTFGKIKIEIFKEFKLGDAKKAHEELEARKLKGPCILIP